MDEIIANMTPLELLIAIRDEAHAGRTESLYAHEKTWAAVCELLNVRCARIERFASGLRDRLGLEDDVLASTGAPAATH